MTDIIRNEYAESAATDGDIKEYIAATDIVIGSADQAERGESGVAAAPVLPLLPTSREEEGDDVYTPAPTLNPVVEALKNANLYLEDVGAGQHRVTCAWAAEHSAGEASEATYAEPDPRHAVGQFRCNHSHAESRDTVRLIEHLGLTEAAARAKARILVSPGDAHIASMAAEGVLALDGRYFQAGGPIVHITSDPVGGGVTSRLVNDQTLIGILSEKIDWVKRGRTGLERTDPPSNVVQLVLRGQVRHHLQPLNGISHQPFYRTDGTLVTSQGYDAESGIYAAFDPAQYELPKPSREAAEWALDYMKWFLRGFHFASDTDKSAALCAMITAAIRPSLPQAPAFSISATRSGSGKSYLAKIISTFVGPNDPHSISYPTTGDEATKVLLAIMLEKPGVVLFDDMQGNWKAYTAINKALTSPTTTERLLGSSRTATASTNVLMMGTGNNIEPERDMLRRVVSIKLAAPGETPALLQYDGNPAADIRQYRTRAVTAVLTILEAFKAAGSPIIPVSTIGTFEDWSSLCRQPLLWLGEPDPAGSLIAQVTSDPDQERLADLFQAWFQWFGHDAVTVRKVIAAAISDPALMELFDELPVTERGHINPGKLGWFFKQNLGRIAGGFRLENEPASGRRGWKVVPLDGSKARVPGSLPGDVF